MYFLNYELNISKLKLSNNRSINMYVLGHPQPSKPSELSDFVLEGTRSLRVHSDICKINLDSFPQMTDLFILIN